MKSIFLSTVFICASSVQAQVPSVLWKFKTDGPVISTPCVANGMIYFGSADSNIYAVDASTGRRKWKFGTEEPVTGSATAANGVVFVASWDGNLYALNATSGKVKWKFKMGYEKHFQAPHLHGQFPEEQTIPDPWDFYMSTPAVGGGNIYIGCGNGNVYSVRESDGKLVWKFKTGGVVHASPTLANGLVYIGSWDSRFYALDMKSGKKRWVFQAGVDPVRHNQQGFQGSAAVKDGVVYVGCRDAHVYALDAITGRKLWGYKDGTGWVSNRPLVTGNVVWDGSNPFRALNLKSGALIVNTKKVGVFSNPTSSGRMGFFGTLSGSLFAFDTTDGHTVWEFQTDARKENSLKLMDSEGKYNLPAWNPVFGDFQDDYVQMYRRFSLGSILSSPTVANGHIYFGSADGNCYALDISG